MAQNQLFDAMLDLAPRYLIRANEPSGSTLADSSGNALDFTRTAGTGSLGTTGPFYTGKNDAATNTVWTVGSGYARRASLTQTIANIATTGVTFVAWVKGGSGNYQTILDSQDATPKNGLRIITNANGAYAGTPTVAMIDITDAAGNRSWKEFTDNTRAWWTDGLWHLVVVVARKAQASVGNEVLDLYVDGIKETATGSSLGGATGTFSDPGGSQYHTLGKYTGGAGGGNNLEMGPSAWYNILLTEEQILALYHSAAYTVGSAAYGYAAGSVNGCWHGDAAQTVYADIAVPATAGDYVKYWDNQSDPVTQAGNTAGNTTNPILKTDALGRRGLLFDGVYQTDGSAPRPTLAITAPFSSTPYRMGMYAYAQCHGSSYNAIGQCNIAKHVRASANANAVSLTHYDTPYLVVNSTTLTTGDTTTPSVACSPSPGMLGITAGGQGALGNVSITCNGITAAASAGMSGGFWYNALDGDITIGSVGGASGFFSGLLHELFISNRALHPREIAALNAYWDSKWLADQQDTLLEIWGDSISLGWPNTPYTTDNNLWQTTGLSSAIQRRIHVRNVSWAGADSGDLKKNDGSGTDLSASGGDNLTTRNSALVKWGARGRRNPGVDDASIAAWMSFTNDIGHAGTGSAGNVGNQSIKNYITWRTNVLARDPRRKILVVFPPAEYGAADATGTYTTILAWFTAHPEMYDEFVQISDVISNWVHPGVADYPIIGREIGAVLAPMLPPASSGISPFGLGRSRGR